MGTSFSSNLEALFGKMENFITTKTVVGEPITIGEIIILPLIEVAFGVGAGATDTEKDAKKEMGAGGLGAKITPSAVLVIQNGGVQLVNIKNQDSVNKLIDMVPGVLAKLNFGSMFNKAKKEPEAPEKPAAEEAVEAVKFEEVTYSETI